MRSPQSTGVEAVAVTTARGVRVLAPSLRLRRPSVRGSPAYGRLVHAVDAMRASLPAQSAAAVRRAVRIFRVFLRWAGLSNRPVSATAVSAFLMSRVAPPRGCSLPPHAAWRRPVLPVTAAADVDTLRRAARLNYGGASAWRHALCAAEVLDLQRVIGGRIKRLTTAKQPILMHQVRTFWEMRGRSAEGVRDAAAAVLGFFFACRAREIIGLRVGDVTVGRDEVVVRFWHEKARRPGVAGPLEARLVGCAHPFAVAALREYVARWRGARRPADSPFFGGEGTALGHAWLRGVAARVASGATPHGLRVGLATEAHAAGCSVEDIRRMGRWSSDAAVLYIVSSLDAQLAASRLVGSGELRWSGGCLRGFSRGQARLWRAAWSAEEPRGVGSRGTRCGDEHWELVGWGTYSHQRERNYSRGESAVYLHCPPA